MNGLRITYLEPVRISVWHAVGEHTDVSGHGLLWKAVWWAQDLIGVVDGGPVHEMTSLAGLELSCIELVSVLKAVNTDFELGSWESDGERNKGAKSDSEVDELHFGLYAASLAKFTHEKVRR